MINKLKRAVKKYGIAKVSADLGYRSTGTILNWFKENRIPRLAESRVKQYLKGKSL